jgi:hypothetical protein
LDCKTICQLPFGAYAQVHDDIQTTNTMKSRTTGGINIEPSNMRGGHKCKSMETSEISVRRRWTKLPGWMMWYNDWRKNYLKT